MHTRQSISFLVSLLCVAGALSGCASATHGGGDSEQLADLFSSKDDQRAIAGCLGDKGWDAEFNSEDGTISTRVTPDQDSAYERDMEACLHEVGIDADGELSTTEYDLAFQWYSDIGTCLSDAGWEVPPQPTRQTFESTYDSKPWIPWALVPGDQMHDARDACPMLNAPQS